MYFKGEQWEESDLETDLELKRLSWVTVTFSLKFVVSCQITTVRNITEDGDYGGEGIEAGKRLLGAALTLLSTTEISLQHARHIKTILVRVLSCSCACCRIISVVDGGVRAAPSRKQDYRSCTPKQKSDYDLLVAEIRK